MVQSLDNAIYSASATAVAEFLTLPICTVKTNLQNTLDMNKPVSIGTVVRDIHNRGGIRAFYKASYPAIGGQMFSTTSKYVLYRYLEEIDGLPIKNRFLNGMVAGVVSSLATHPMDVAKIHLQMGETIPRRPALYYRGYSKTFSKIAVSSSLFFPLYDTFHQKISNPLVSAIASAIVATVVMHPIDYLKTRHMAGLKIYCGYNPITYYRGLSINLLRVVPHFAITMGLIDYLKRLTQTVSI